MTVTDYAAVTRCFRKHKANVTRYKNVGEDVKVVRECIAAIEDFDRYGWPDDWAHFRRTVDDIRFAQRFEETPGLADALRDFDAIDRL